jgi:uncharacterized cofD-like protein
MRAMQLRVIKIGCCGGGTGLPSLLGGLKRNPWLDVNAIVTMFDNGGSSGQLRDEFGVLPPGDVLKCALALARNEREARRLLLSRLPTLDDSRLAGHTGGNLLLSMMERYSGNFLAAIEGLRALLGCKGRVWPVSIESSSVCAGYRDGSETRGEAQVDAQQARGRAIERIWLDPPVRIHRVVAGAIAEVEAIVIGPGSFFTSLMPIFAVDGTREALSAVNGPIIVVSNLLTEGLGMQGFTAADAVSRIELAIGRDVDAVIFNEERPPAAVLARYAGESKEPLELGAMPEHCRLVTGRFWRTEIARHHRARLAYAVWSVLAQEVARRSPDRRDLATPVPQHDRRA